MLDTAHPQVHTVVFAAGQSRRFQSQKSKILHKVANQPVLAHIATQANQISGRKTLVVSKKLQADLAKEKWFDTTLEGWSLALQSQPKGTGDALLCALESISENQDILLS